jgi:hypothetical protein
MPSSSKLTRRSKRQHRRVTRRKLALPSIAEVNESSGYAAGSDSSASASPMGIIPTYINGPLKHKNTDPVNLIKKIMARSGITMKQKQKYARYVISQFTPQRLERLERIQKIRSGQHKLRSVPANVQERMTRGNNPANIVDYVLGKEKLTMEQKEAVVQHILKQYPASRLEAMEI